MNPCIYHIQIRGQVDEDEINGMSPLHMERDWVDTAVTQFSVHSDQSGLVGLLRHLHGLGFVFPSVNYEQQANLTQGDCRLDNLAIGSFENVPIRPKSRISAKFFISQAKQMRQFSSILANLRSLRLP